MAGSYRVSLYPEQQSAPINMTPQPVIPHDDSYFQEHYNTPIPADKQQDFEKWKFQQSLAQKRDITKDAVDYDIQGAAMVVQQPGSNGHGSDQFKKPNHPTFSDQSQYSGQDGYQGGHWAEGPRGVQFTPSETNRVMWSPEQRVRYFQKVEPDARLIEDVGSRPMNVNIRQNGLYKE